MSSLQSRVFACSAVSDCGSDLSVRAAAAAGEFAEADSCCRVHDHCPLVIHAFSSKFGYTNFKWHSICHCDCDER